MLEVAGGGTYNRVILPKLSLPGEDDLLDDETGGDGSKRGIIKGFSDDSRGRFNDCINSLDDAKLREYCPIFTTLTYPNVFPDPMEAKKHLKAFIRKAVREFDACGFWKLEPQKRGAPHFHLVLFLQPSQVVAFNEWVPTTWHEIAGYSIPWHLLWHQGKLGGKNRHCCEEVKGDRKCILSYLGKYIGKKFDRMPGWDWPGRFWGVVQLDRVEALKSLVKVNINRAAAIKLRRLMWRWMKHQPSGRVMLVDPGIVGFHYVPNYTDLASVKGAVIIDPGQRKVEAKGFFSPKEIEAHLHRGGEVVPIMRKVQSKGRTYQGQSFGGCRVYMPEKEFRRLVKHVFNEFGLTDPVTEHLEGCPI